MPFLLSLPSTGYCISCVGAFFYRPEWVLLCSVILWGEPWFCLMMEVLLLCHGCSDLGSILSGDVGKLRAEDSSLLGKENRIIWSNRRMQHFITQSKQKASWKKLARSILHVKTKLCLLGFAATSSGPQDFFSCIGNVWFSIECMMTSFSHIFFYTSWMANMWKTHSDALAHVYWAYRPRLNYSLQQRAVTLRGGNVICIFILQSLHISFQIIGLGSSKCFLGIVAWAGANTRLPQRETEGIEFIKLKEWSSEPK